MVDFPIQGLLAMMAMCEVVPDTGRREDAETGEPVEELPAYGSVERGAGRPPRRADCLALYFSEAT
jgi:hypothetical protein